MLRRFQSNFVLPIARYVFLAGAGLAVLGAIGAVVVAVWLHVQGVGTPDLLPAPPPHVPPAATLDLDNIDWRLAPPDKLHFEVTIGYVDRPIEEGDVIGYFEASTRNGLMEYPEDFTILGGRDAGLFRRTRWSQSVPRASLTPTAELVDRINSLREILSGADKADFELTVAARDAYGAYSQPVDVSFSLQFGPPRAKPAAEQSSESGSAVSGGVAVAERTGMQQLAHDIGLVLDPSQSTVYYEAATRAAKVPAQCRASEADTGFLTEFRRAFEHARTRLTAVNIEPFYSGVCESWHEMVDTLDAAAARAEAERNAVAQRNRELERDFSLRRVAMWAARNTALIVALSAFGAFLGLAVVLANLANENHTKAMRELAERQIALLEGRAARGAGRGPTTQHGGS